MLRFIIGFQRKRVERISTAVADHAIVHGYQQVSTEVEESHRNLLFFHKVKTISKKLFSKVPSSPLNHNLGTDTTSADKVQSNGEVLHDDQSWEDDERTFNRFQDLPIELRVSVSATIQLRSTLLFTLVNYN